MKYRMSLLIIWRSSDNSYNSASLVKLEKRASGRIGHHLPIVNEGDNLYQDELPEESFETVMRESPTAMIIDRGLDLSKVIFCLFSGNYFYHCHLLLVEGSTKYDSEP